MLAVFDQLRGFASPPLIALAAGLALGISVVLLLRARQVWVRRQTYGYSVYRADTARARLTRWALAGVAGALVVGGLYLWWSGRPAASPEGQNETTGQSVVVTGTRFLIPRLAVDTSIIEAPFVAQQWDISRLRYEVAHLAGTAYPGEPGNAVLAGHVTVPDAGFGPFRDLEKLEPGDHIYIEMAEQTLVYEVVETLVVLPTDVDVAFPTEDTRLTLITCTGWSDILQSYAQRVVVIARPLE